MSEAAKNSPKHYRFKKGNRCAKGNPPNRTSFKKGQRSSSTTEFKKGEHMGKNHHRWKGGKVNWGKYIFVYRPKHPFNNHGYVAQHRVVMEKHLGRYLKPKEVIHHKNSNASDNRIENLQLFPNHSGHMKNHN